MRTIRTLLATLLFAPLAFAADTLVKNVSVEEAEKVLKERKDVTVLDLRTADEFKAGHLAGAQNLDFIEAGFAKQLATLDRSKTYLVHCASGNRTTKALPVFREQKFTALLHLDGGFKAWEKAGKPVEK